MSLRQKERHRTERIGWLRATVLGANDGIVSTASLVLGVAAAHATHSNILIAGVAGLVAGAMSMAAGEYVSVHSQADTEQADLALERTELKIRRACSPREISAFTSVAASILRSPKRSQINSWPMTRSARMRATNSASLRHSVRVRYRRRLPPRAVSLWEQGCLS